MRFSWSTAFVLTTASLFAQEVAGENYIESTSLSTCQDRSQLTANLFRVRFTPDNASVEYTLEGISTIDGEVTIQVVAQAYGYTLLNQTLDPCELKLYGICPMRAGKIPSITSNQNISQSVVDQLPVVAYGIPDLDALVTLNFYSKSNPGVSLACLQARLTNGKTVDQGGVAWATAAVIGAGLLTSAVVSGLGHYNAAAHIATYTLLLFSYFQAISIAGLVAVPLPPIVQGWTQDFSWTMGIIRVNFLQRIATWYLTSTGGVPAELLDSLTVTSVQVLKRSLSFLATKSDKSAYTSAATRAVHHGYNKRSVYQNTINAVTGTYVVKGIDRVAFKSGMEASNIFMTGLTFFCILFCFTVIGVLLFRVLYGFSVKRKWVNGERYVDFRNSWKVLLKGIMFKLVLICYPQMAILCIWELTQVNSPAEVVLAVFFFVSMSFTLGWAALKVLKIGQRSEKLHRSAAYTLYSNADVLNKWGFIYIPFRANAYYYILPILVYTLIKAMFVSLGQPSGPAQAIGLLLLEAFALIGASVLRPWMDKSTNNISIAIYSMNFVNAICLLIFSNVFDQPALATGVVGVLFFLFNAIFALVLLIIVVVTIVQAIISKNPDTRYRPMKDNRESFIKSQTTFNNELNALALSARGETRDSGSKHDIELEHDNDSSASIPMHQMGASGIFRPTSGVGLIHPGQLYSSNNTQTSFHDAGNRVYSIGSRSEISSRQMLRDANHAESNMNNDTTRTPSPRLHDQAKPKKSNIGSHSSMKSDASFSKSPLHNMTN